MLSIRVWRASLSVNSHRSADRTTPCSRDVLTTTWSAAAVSSAADDAVMGAGESTSSSLHVGSQTRTELMKGRVDHHRRATRNIQARRQQETRISDKTQTDGQTDGP